MHDFIIDMAIIGSYCFTTDDGIAAMCIVNSICGSLFGTLLCFGGKYPFVLSEIQQALFIIDVQIDGEGCVPQKWQYILVLSHCLR